MMGALIRALTNNAVENIEEALGMTDATSSAMKHAIAEWYAAWYGRAPTKTEDPCQRLPYAIVNKLCKATFGEYDSGLQHTDSAKGKYLDRVRNTFDACKTSFMTQAMIGGEAWAKPVPMPDERLTWQIVGRDSVIILGRDASGIPSDVTPTGNDGEYDVSRSEGIIMEDGDAFDADTMNDLERRVAAGFTEFDPTGAGGGEVTVQPYTCEKKNGVYALVGSGAVGRCKIPASWAAGDSFTVNGAAVPAYCGADAVDGDTIVKGRWVLFFYDGTQLNFNGGGGLSTTKLALATATEDNVLAGNKFYAGSKTIKDGTLTLTGNVTADKMLEGSSGYADDAHSIVAGRMPNRGSWGATLSPGGVATVPSGYHDGSGQVTARPLRFLDLGVGQNFNVAAVFSDYRSLTVDNFVVYSVSSAHTGNSAWHHIERMNKSYNAASGKFNCSVVLGEYSDAYGGPTNYAYASVGVKIVY